MRAQRRSLGRRRPQQDTEAGRPVAFGSGQFKPLTMCIDQAPFSDVNVRQALRLLVDRQQDIAQAKSLLKKAGMENMTVGLTTSAVATGMVAMATVLAEQAVAAGVTIKIHQVDPGTFFGATTSRRAVGVPLPNWDMEHFWFV
jgi:peptide/nickel transport system substrate-binding protein